MVSGYRQDWGGSLNELPTVLRKQWKNADDKNSAAQGTERQRGAY